MLFGLLPSMPETHGSVERVKSSWKEISHTFSYFLLQSQYKTTIYNINTINLAGLLKNQSNPNEVRSNDRESAAASRPSIPNVSSQSAARVMDESNRYRETFANAYARHLLELTRTAVEKVDPLSCTLSVAAQEVNRTNVFRKPLFRHRRILLQLVSIPRLAVLAWRW